MAGAYLEALRALPVQGPPVEVRFTDYSYTVDVPATTARSKPYNMLDATVDFCKLPYTVFQRTPMKKLNVLEKFSGTFKPGTATLILGNPGSGRSTLLRAVAGRMPAGSAGVSGTVTWNGEAPDFKGQSPAKLAAIAPQADSHEALLTVRETFEFAVDNCLAHLPADAPEAERELRGHLVEHTIDMLGLRECADTIVGNEMRRGISGGQRRRVTIGETLLSGARVLCLDEPTNGLDAQYALAIMAALVDWAHITGGTLVTTLSAPTPETVRLFDQICMLSDGYVFYNGARTEMTAFAAQQGYVTPKNVDGADYIVTMAASPAYAATAFRDLQPPLPPGFTPPTSRAELAAIWAKRYAELESAPGAAPPLTGGVALDTPALRAQYAVPYVHSTGEHTRLLFARQVTLMKRNALVYIIRVLQFCIVAAIFGSVYWQLPTQQAQQRVSLMMFILSAIAFGAFADIPALFQSKRTAARQHEAGMYPSLPFTLSALLTSLPVGWVCSFCMTTILYFMAGFPAEGGRYWFFVMVAMLHEMACSAIFKLFVFMFVTESTTQAMAGVFVGMCSVCAGFYIPYNLIPPWFWPLFYFSPFSWALRSMVDSQFGATAYLGPSTVASQNLGQFMMASLGFYSSYGWMWGGVGLLIGYYLLFGPLLCSVTVAKLLKPDLVPGSQRLAEVKPTLSEAHSVRAMVQDGLSTEAAREAVATSKPTGRNPLSMEVEAGAPGSPAAEEEAAAGEPLTPAGEASTRSADPAAQVATIPVAPAQPAIPQKARIPFTPATLTWKDIQYSVKLKGGAVRPLLRNLSGTARPGRMMALMGASGAGKTTLMDVLAFRKTTGTIKGEININGVPVDRKAFAYVAGYCEQADTHAQYATVREALQFSARLRLPADVPAENRNAFVELIIFALEMSPIADRMTHTLAPAEAKRLTIAVELCGNPAVIFLDEPTTGLDARAAALVMRVIRRVASTGRTVICTIHQPSMEVFTAFDDLTLLVPGGYAAFHGAIGKNAEDLVSYLQGCPGVVPLGPGVNPASWMVEQTAAIQAAAKAAKEASSLSGSAHVKSAAGEVSKLGVMDAPTYYTGSELAKVNTALLDSIHTTPPKAGDKWLCEEDMSRKPRPNFGVQLWFLVVRQLLFMWRNTSWNFMRIIVNIVLSLYFGLLYFKVDTNTWSGIFSLQAAFLNGLLFTSIVAGNTGVPIFSKARTVFYREAAAGYYQTAAFPLALAFTELPMAVASATVFLLINYWMVGFTSTAQAWFLMWFTFILVPWWWVILAQALVALMPVAGLASMMLAPATQLSTLFGGVNIPVNLLPTGWQWFYYVNGFAYALRIPMLVQFSSSSETVYAPPGTGTGSATGQWVTKQQFMEDRLGANVGQLGENVGILIAIVALGFIVHSLIWSYVNHQKR